MAELPLLISEVYAYGFRQGFGVDIDFFYRSITELDDEYMLHILKERKDQSEQQSKEEKKKPAKPDK